MKDESTPKEILSFLRSKIKCLKKYLATTRDFVAVSDLKSLQSFEVKRDGILKAIQLFERKLSEAVQKLPASLRTPALIEQVQAAESESQSLVQEILAADTEILAKIDRIREDLTREVTQSRKHKDKLNKFKSNWAEGPSGKELDEKL